VLASAVPPRPEQPVAVLLLLPVAYCWGGVGRLTLFFWDGEIAVECHLGSQKLPYY
jgi:hypothetical protein